MLHFSEDFFEEEVRENFKVSGTMKRAWAAQMELMAELDDIMKENGIRYFAYGGTLLGCIRHGGFIPWDDDIDIMMKREEYEKLLEIAQRKFPAGCVDNMYTNEKNPMTFTRIRNSDLIDLSEEHLAKYHGCPFIVGIDVFPLDYLPEDEQERERQKQILFLISNLVTIYHTLERLEKTNSKNADMEEASPEACREALEEGLQTLEEFCGVTFDRGANIANQLSRLYDRICASCPPEQSSILTSMPEHVQNKGIYMPREWFEAQEEQRLEFECMSLPVPLESEQILEMLYGDWKIPVFNGGDHEYPFYKNQLQWFWKKNLFLDMKL